MSAYSASHPREVIVISDLHIGGEMAAKGAGRGFRMNSKVRELATFISKLAAREPRGSIELVINGDFVDVLAERFVPSPATLDPYNAADLAVFSRLLERDARLFAALGAFAKRHRLTLLLGNHDVELALPPFRRLFEATVGAELGHDIRFFDDNEAYVIGDVLIEHGNRYDEFNTVPHDDLRRLRSLVSRREHDDRVTFPPPPGSQLVVQIMNEIKKDYPFIDLLKPETSAAVPLLLAFEPRFASLATPLAKLYGEARKHKPATDGTIPQLTNMSGGGPAPAPAEPSAPPVDLIPVEMSAEIRAANERANARDLEGMSEVEALLRREPLRPVSDPKQPGDAALVPVAAGDTLMQLLGVAELIVRRTLVARMPALKRALQVVRDDRSFVLGTDEDNSPYVRAAKRLATAQVRHVIFGHTHLVKQIELGDKRSYINTGTWADLAQLPFDELMKDTDAKLADKFESFLGELKTSGQHEWIRWEPFYASFHVDENGQTTTPRLVDARTIIGPEKPSP